MQEEGWHPLAPSQFPFWLPLLTEPSRKGRWENPAVTQPVVSYSKLECPKTRNTGLVYRGIGWDKPWQPTCTAVTSPRDKQSSLEANAQVQLTTDLIQNEMVLLDNRLFLLGIKTYRLQIWGWYCTVRIDTSEGSSTTYLHWLIAAISSPPTHRRPNSSSANSSPAQLISSTNLR